MIKVTKMNGSPEETDSIRIVFNQNIKSSEYQKNETQLKEKSKEELAPFNDNLVQEITKEEK